MNKTTIVSWMLLAACSAGTMVSAATAHADVVSTITNRRNHADKIEINCSDEQCSTVEITHRDGQNLPEAIASMDKKTYTRVMTRVVDIDKVTFKKYFFMITQGVASLPWDDSEFRVCYFLLAPFSIPLTVAAETLDIALLPADAVDLVVEAAGGNDGRKVMRNVERKKDFKLNNFRFNRLITDIQKAVNGG